jgi:hypothetical protein
LDIYRKTTIDKYLTMSKNNIDQALTYLASSIQSLVETADKPGINLATFHKDLPKRSLSGDHISGGKILGFASAGINDKATAEQIIVEDNNVYISKIRTGQVLGDLSVEKSVIAENINVLGTLKAQTIEVNELKADLRLERSSSLEFKKTDQEGIFGKGILWVGEGNAKQFVYNGNPDRLFSSESIYLGKDKHIGIDNIPVLSSTALGNTVVKSNLREVGRLKGLLVDGDVVLDQYVFYNSTASRLGVGIELPNAGFSVAEDGIEVMVGSREQTRGIIGTYASKQFDIVTDNISRISIGAGGDILLGNTTEQPIQVSVHGKVAIRVKNPDPEVDLHVGGAVRFHGHIHQYADASPTSGNFKPGDVVWNTNPQTHAGWICVRAGNPGEWKKFGKLE